MPALSRTLFAAYLLILTWVVLFKFSYYPIAVIRGVQTQSINLIPFTRSNNGEMFANFAAFIPFGVMLGVCFKQITFRHKAAVVLAFSLALEVIQYALAIGVTDITDVILNSLGGIVGLAAYAVAGKRIEGRYLDAGIFAAGTLTLLAVLYLRVFVFIVRY